MGGFDDDFARLDNEAAQIPNDDNKRNNIIIGGHKSRPHNRRNEDEECSYNSHGEDVQLDESIQELEKISAIPQLKKNTEKKQQESMSPDRRNQNNGNMIVPL